jgi:hypothetical protein
MCGLCYYRIHFAPGSADDTEHVLDERAHTFVGLTGETCA